MEIEDVAAEKNTEPDPGQSATSEDFITALAQLRIVSGESYQSLQSRTGVPRSTLFDMLSRRRKPRMEVLSAVVDAFADDAAQSATWMGVWRRLQLASPEADEPTEIKPENKRTLSRKQWIGVAAAIVVLAGATGLRPWAPTPEKPGARLQRVNVTLPVYNVETACQRPRVIECGLSVVRDPRAAGSAANRVVRVWHGDGLVVNCVAQGRLIVDEQGMSSSLWYAVRVPGQDVTGWFPGIRLRNVDELRQCPPLDPPPGR